MSTSRNVTPSRRGILAAGGAVGIGALLAACGGGKDSGGANGDAKTGPWSFTDDRKEKVSLKSTPQRIVAFTGTAAALHDFGIDDQIVGVFGPTKLKNGKPDPQAGDLDVDKVTIIGNAYNQFNVEKYASLRPDLLVTNMYEPGALWFVPDDSKDKITPLAKSVAITSARVPLLKIIERYADLAKSLGADLGAKKVTDAKARFEKASEALRKAAKSHPVKVLACSGSPDLFYASNPGINADLMYYKSLGVDLIVPDHLDKGGYFESLSWENADKYKADVLLLDNRTATLQPKDLAAKPSWAKLPAVKAGQITPWSSEPRFSYAGAAPLIESLTKAIEGAKKTK
ncbi:ABC transporter substrate-binding protein [Streptomyces libani]|uniref:ABC transporter substrate-binding protein n=2 Tax=Streptomyces nigrescens TaxID=1920 RepID=A0A640TPW2_STRNI|nr:MULTISPECIES: ABC transporter substrate-binding protein [Streptomyces]MCW7984232.1 ABC transporter substrate-binding protein [Streptomyces platensis subsp. clarensis]AWN26521.1 ABC transporter substrate-binding protein [Streptomyces sp. NEAU-S7GS2]MCX5451630.1 ABC transporter substrate-binding protein [Streptomyces libani]MYX10359.1 ABC transporter substrate-binding protein [Streptomyces sp. SID8375]WAT99788.1 ABC transporter substrate-binding protein [Streptomyces libani subsp. libani]